MPGYSDPLDEQHFIVNVINALQNSPEWSETAVVHSCMTTPTAGTIIKCRRS